MTYVCVKHVDTDLKVDGRLQYASEGHKCEHIGCENIARYWMVNKE